MSAFSRPLHIRPDGAACVLERISLGAGDSPYNEKWLQRQLFAFPETLPVTEIDPHAGALVPVCMELRTDGGPADILYVTHTGKIVLVETKLWRNAEARRIVVAQILDYAKELSGWTYEDLAREAAQASGDGPDHLLKCVRSRHPDLDEALFVDGINRSLEKGDFILVIAGDGIRSGAEALVSFLDRYGHLRFQFALVEIASYHLADGTLLLQPRVLAKTELLRRTVYVPQHADAAAQPAPDVDEAAEAGIKPAPNPVAGDRWFKFWQEFVKRLVLDDLQQPSPQAARGPAIFLTMPPGGRHQVWITVYVMQSERRAGVFLTFGKSLPDVGKWFERLLEQRVEIASVLADLEWGMKGDGSLRITAPPVEVTDLDAPAQREAVLRHLCDHTNRMVNAFRHRLTQLNREGGTAS